MPYNPTEMNDYEKAKQDHYNHGQDMANQKKLREIASGGGGGGGSRGGGKSRGGGGGGGSRGGGGGGTKSDADFVQILASLAALVVCLGGVILWFRDPELHQAPFIGIFIVACLLAGVVYWAINKPLRPVFNFIGILIGYAIAIAVIGSIGYGLLIIVSGWNPNQDGGPNSKQTDRVQSEQRPERSKGVIGM